MEDRVAQALKAALARGGHAVEPDILEYLAGTCAGVLEEAADRQAAEQELREAVEAQLEEAGATADEIGAICAEVAAVKFGAPAVATGSAPSSAAAPVAAADSGAADAGSGKSASGAAAAGTSDDDLICRVEDLILMYGGSSKALLSHTAFELRRGHRYGIVGHNGAGKTTLMSALLSGAVKALPSSLRLVHVHGGSVMETGDPEMTALQFATQRRTELGLQQSGQAAVEAAEALEAVGFGADMQAKTLSQLSGGWRMRLALACAMMESCDVLLLDEPTNHLDTAAIDWLGSYLQGLAGTSLIISHEPGFLDEVCTDIVHFDEQKLKYYSGNFSAFLEQTAIDDEEAKAVLETKSRPSMASAGKAIQGHQDALRLSFPIPGKLDGVSSTTKPILEVKKVSFQYSEGLPMILKEVSCKLSLSSRVAVLGANGAGKSTLLAVLCGELPPAEIGGNEVGEVTRHRNMRLSYIAQHHTFHLEEFLKCTPVHYFQLRFRNGYDEQLQKRLMDPGNEEEQRIRAEMASKYGKYGNKVRDIVGRQKRGKEVLYEVAWEGLDDAKQNTFEPLSKLKMMRVDGLARAYDERFAAQAAGTSERPLTEREIVKHLESFQMSEEMCTKRMIGGFSAGQKSRLMLGAAFWTKPHVIALDEPTNYLDPETVNALARALKNFRGGVIAVTHSQHFVDEVCTEAWHVVNGSVTVSKLENAASASAAPTPTAAKASASAPAFEPEPSSGPVPLSAAAAALAAAASRKR